MLISPPEKTSPSPKSREEPNDITNAQSNNDIPNKTLCGTEISIDFSKIPIEKTKKNVTIQITSVNDRQSLNNTEETSKETISSSPSKDKLIRLKIKMPKSPKSPKGCVEIKRDRSFFTEKDFSTLPKEFIKFANSMISGDEPKRDAFKTNLEAKKRYCDKSLNEERRINQDVEKEFGTLSPIMQESTTNIPSSTPKDVEEILLETQDQERKKLEPLYFTKIDNTISAGEKMENHPEFKHLKGKEIDVGFKETDERFKQISPEFKQIHPEFKQINSGFKETHKFKEINSQKLEEINYEPREINYGSRGINCRFKDTDCESNSDPKGSNQLRDINDISTETKSEFKGVKICDVIEKQPQDIALKPYEDIIAKLKPYSKYRMQYLHNLRKLQSKECVKYRDRDFYLPTTEEEEEEESPATVTKFYNNTDIDENELLQLVNQSTRYRPLMGKNALFSKIGRRWEDDSEIVKELVTEKFSPFFERRRRERKDNINNYSLPIDCIGYDGKEEKLQKINNNLNQTVHRIVVNEEFYAVINKNNKLKELEAERIEEEEMLKSVSKISNNNQTYQDIEPSKPNEFSSYSDYDVEKFLQNATGDVSLLSQTMDTSPQSKYPGLRSEDHSIATGEMSLLVSKASSISTFCSTIWRRITRRNSAIAPQDAVAGEEDEEQLRKEERNKRITLLNQEASVQNEIIRQASKALDYCEHLPGVDFLSQRVEAERVILIATHKNRMIQHEIEDVTYYSTIRSTCSYLGSFSVRNLQFKVKDVCRKQDECSQWFVCIVNRGTETLASTAVQADEDGYVAFKQEFSFEYLPPDFEIGVSVYTLKVKKHKDPKSSFQRLKFFSFRRDSKTAVGRKTLTSRFSRTSLRSPSKDYALPSMPIRQTSFLFLGESTLTIKDVAKSSLNLTNIANFANICETFNASMSSNVNIDESFSDFLNMGTELGEKIIWNRRWCTLQNTHFKYWNSPNDEETDEPLKIIDLTYSIKEVASADRSLCPRARTLQLEVLAPLISEENDRYTVERYFLTSDTSESMHNWEKSLNSIIGTLKAWNCLKSNNLL